MKTKLLLIAISCTTLLFTSCEKEEMGDGGLGGGGGMQDPNTITKSTTPMEDNEINLVADTTLKVDE